MLDISIDFYYAPKLYGSATLSNDRGAGTEGDIVAAVREVESYTSGCKNNQVREQGESGRVVPYSQASFFFFTILLPCERVSVAIRP